MYKIKQIPEDFIVKEISDIKAGNGQYAYFLLKKTSYTTIDALQILSNKFKVRLKHFGFAGNKDRNAVTEQKISISRGSRNLENFEFNNIELKYLGNGKEPICLGDLGGNEFKITIRNLSNDKIRKIKKLKNKNIKIPNLYGPQRFSKNNPLVGKAIIKRDFKKAVDLILQNNGFAEGDIIKSLEESKNNYVQALRLIPLKTRRLFVHSYQSFLFNKIILKYLKKQNNKIKNTQIPVIGFDFEINSVKHSQLKNIIKKIMYEESVSPREFIISQIPELTSEGGFRDMFFELKFKIWGINDDELNKNKKKAILNFTLPKSCYATVALEHILKVY